MQSCRGSSCNLWMQVKHDVKVSMESSVMSCHEIVKRSAECDTEASWRRILFELEGTGIYIVSRLNVFCQKKIVSGRIEHEPLWFRCWTRMHMALVQLMKLHPMANFWLHNQSSLWCMASLLSVSSMLRKVRYFQWKAFFFCARTFYTFSLILILQQAGHRMNVGSRGKPLSNLPLKKACLKQKLVTEYWTDSFFCKKYRCMGFLVGSALPLFCLG